MMWRKFLACDFSVGNGKAANQQFALPCDDKSNCDHEPDDREQEDRANDLITGEAHRDRARQLYSLVSSMPVL